MELLGAEDFAAGVSFLDADEGAVEDADDDAPDDEPPEEEPPESDDEEEDDEPDEPDAAARESVR